MPEPWMTSWSCCPSPDHLGWSALVPERKIGLVSCALFCFVVLLSLSFLGLDYL